MSSLATLEALLRLLAVFRVVTCLAAIVAFTILRRPSFAFELSSTATEESFNVCVGNVVKANEGVAQEETLSWFARMTAPTFGRSAASKLFTELPGAKTPPRAKTAFGSSVATRSNPRRPEQRG